MLIGMIGSPISGKTTTAALAFAKLKDLGITAEYIPEQARIYIAEKRIKTRSSPSQPIILDNHDQLEIMSKQLLAEMVMVQACDVRTIIISDSSVINSLFYMSSEFRASSEVKKLVQTALGQYSMHFLSQPVVNMVVEDANRVHTKEQSLEINMQIPLILQSVGLTEGKLFTLNGSAEARSKEMISRMMELRGS